ncbi:GH36-type glycosyl hydrolase domain-containing protein [Brachymonas denitrificans]|uniref:GH36-type glycosyl hydrolase domain-containing protein n=1 Tax=Brachymonas denitrificans TaxID=28220 RepID=UPI003220063E
MPAIKGFSLRAVLDGLTGFRSPIEAPIRAELFGPARFRLHGEHLAAIHDAHTPHWLRSKPFFPRLRQNIADLHKSREVLEQLTADGRHPGPAAQWLLDNASVIDAQALAIREGLPPSFFRKLPRLRSEPLAGLPRIYGVVWAYVAHADSHLDNDLLEGFLGGYLAERYLSLAELWSFPTTLRVVLLENLARLALRTAALQAARDAAHSWFDGPEQQRTIRQLDQLDQRFRRLGVEEAFLLQVEQRQEDLSYDYSRQLHAWLKVRLQDPAATEARHQAALTEDEQSIRNAITTLRKIDQVNWRELFARHNAVMRIMATCPQHMAESLPTQDRTLHAIERLARKSRRPEPEVAQTLVDLTAQGEGPDAPLVAPAYWWRGEGEPQLRKALGLSPRRFPARTSPMRRRWNAWAYLLTVVLITGWLTLRVMDLGYQGPDIHGWVWAVTAYLLLAPLGETVVALVNRLISESVQPAVLHRMALRQGIPQAHQTLVVIPSMLTSEKGTRELLIQLEQHHLANPETHAQFALLSDFADAATQAVEGDDAALAFARAGVTELNQRYPVEPGRPLRFLVLHRTREWSDTQQCYIGWERKRGKLEQLVQALAESAETLPAPFIDLGELSRVAPGVRHLVTLDSDTDMPPGRLRELVAIAAHPLNQPRIEPGTRFISRGYGILQPRIATPMPTTEAGTWFHSLFAGRLGVDPYSAASSEIYQDVFGQGTFTGKGLLNVQATHTVLGGQLPPEHVLSHDLLEGALLRCAGVSDVTFVEDAPMHADVAASRLHRWTRGDWQLLPLIGLLWRERVPLINYWKVADNLRRSMVAPFSALLLLWVAFTQTLPFHWALIAVLAAYGGGPLLGALAGLAPHRDDIALRHFFAEGFKDLGRALVTPLWHLATLLDQAVLYGDAVLRALYRQLVSRRLLLEWMTAAAAQASVRTDLPSLLRKHKATVLMVGVLLAGAVGAHLAGWPVNWMALLPLLLLWALVPVWVAVISRLRPRPRRERITQQQRSYLFELAHDTWRFYDRHVGEEDNFLPPDNVQMQPFQMVAHRTSPTNIGMYLLVLACARQIGFIGRADLVTRLRATLATLERMPRHAGHFYNWYDTRTLAVLPPGYVSTVDSGNCSGHLLVVARACEEAAALEAEPHTALECTLEWSAMRLEPLLAQLQPLEWFASVADLVHATPPSPGGAPLAALLARVEASRERAELTRQSASPTLEPALAQLTDHLTILASLLHDQMAQPLQLRAQLLDLGARCRTLALEPDYSILYDHDRRLLHIGLRTETGELDANHYDLLVSESRLTSLVAIAKGDVPPEHWAALGRPYFFNERGLGIKSWSGSMFEYLMPTLVLDEPPASALGHVTRQAILEQRADGEELDTPWGISESAIAGQDQTLAYQYGPQGVAALALRRTPTDVRVVAPYATAMATMLYPGAAIDNLRRLQELGMRGDMGFIESLDYTPQRQLAGRVSTPVHTYMAHHQAMSLVAFTDVLCDNAPRHWAMTDPYLRAVAALLHEATPRVVQPLPPPSSRPISSSAGPTYMAQLEEPLLAEPATLQLLSNGSHAVWINSRGAGVSRWQGLALTRWRDDPLRDAYGSYLYVERHGDESTPAVRHSLTLLPARDPQARYHAELLPDRALLKASWKDLEALTDVWVSAEDDCELRQVRLENLGDHALELTISFASEITLAAQADDEAHPAFSNLFVRTHWDKADRALYLCRKPRLADYQPMYAAAFLAHCEADIVSVEPCADRSRWVGRHGCSAHVHGDGGYTLLHDDHSVPELPGIAVDTGLDPVAVLRVRLRIPAGVQARLVFAMAASRDPAALEQLVDRYRQEGHVKRSSSMANTMSGVRLHEIQLDPEAWRALLRVQTQLSAQHYREQHLAQNDVERAARLPCDRRLLWRHGISGDRPLLVVSISEESGLPMVQQLRRSLRLWSAGGLGVDMVVLNGEPASYLTPVQRQLQLMRERLLARKDDRWPEHLRAALFILHDSDLSDDERTTLYLLASVRLAADGRTLAQQVLRSGPATGAAEAPAVESVPCRLQVPRLGSAGGVAPASPQGRFDPADGSFSFTLDDGHRPSRPWINVLANPDFGCHVSEVGAGMTWAGNSRMHQLTPWSNDPLGDPAGERLLLEDIDGGEVWTLGQVCQSHAVHVTHGIGFTRMQQQLPGLDVTLTWCVDRDLPVKQCVVMLRNTGVQARRLRLVTLAEWVLGASRRERMSIYTHTEQHVVGPHGVGLPPPQTAPVLYATQLDRAGGFGESTAFLALIGPAGQSQQADWTCDRRELFNSEGCPVLPTRLGQRSGLGLDPCAAVACVLTAQPGATVSAVSILGHGWSLPQARHLAEQVRKTPIVERFEQVRAFWRELCGARQVSSPDPAFDALVNHWLPYQTVVCRLWARAGFYQAGGAFGFRDQLQDAMSMVGHAPELLARQIRRHAGRQFSEGDVQHWWHEPGGAGVRTHFTDDLLWLPLALALYVERTGDHALLDEQVPFLQGSQVPPEREDVYESPHVSGHVDSLYEHGALAIDRSLRTGAHGLPLMGTGDWNDGMNRVGHEGRGESVWLAWFLCEVVRVYLPLARARRDGGRVAAWEQARNGWIDALESDGWDGSWYRRAFFDDGSVLGSASNVEGRIDLIAQAWAVLSAAANPVRARTAMQQADQHLFDHKHQVMRLLTPPLQHAQPSAGYIQAYPPGVRENAGQYNHGAVWGLMAFARLGQAGAAWRAFQGISPAHRWQHNGLGETYALEPYVVAADVYTVEPYAGRGGWSWYTGSSGWLMRAGLESLCGIVLKQDVLHIEPCLPPHWQETSVTVHRDGRSWRVVLCQGEHALQTALAREGQARAHPAGTPVLLEEFPASGVLVVDALPGEWRPKVE